MTRHVILTGGGGFIGSHLAEALVALGDRVTVIDNFVSGKRENLSAVADRIDLIEGDFKTLASHAERIGKANAVIHLAALISGHDSLVDPLPYEQTNVLGLHALIEFVRKKRIGRVLFASSSTVYGQQPEIEVTERTLPRPTSVYALSKLAGEHLLDMYGKLHGFSHCSLRLFNVYGPRQATDHPYANVTCKFANAAAKGLPVLRYGDGNQSRDFVYVSDVVDAFVAALDGAKADIYNVGTGSDHSINDLLDALAELSGKSVAVEDRPPWPNDIRRIRANMDRFEGDFGFRPAVEIGQGLAATVEFFRSA
jgi:UDP-glucose 4-epimerase